MDLPSPPATPREHTTQKLSKVVTESAQTAPPFPDARSNKSDRLRESSKSNPMSLKRRSKSEENLTTLMQRNVFRNSQRSLLAAQHKSLTPRPSVRRRHSSCVEMNSRDTMRIATIYGWVTSDIDYADPYKSSPLIILSNVDQNSRNRRRATAAADQLLSTNNLVHPLDKLEDSKKFTRQRTQSSGWTELSTKPAKIYQDTTRASRRRSLYTTRSATQPSLGTTGKFSKLLIRRRKLGRIPMSKSLPSLLVSTSTDAAQGLPPFPYVDHNYTTERMPSLPSSPASFKKLQKEASTSMANLSARSGKTESIIDVLLAAGTVQDSDTNDMWKDREEAVVNEKANESSSNTPQAAISPPERPLPPVENDPRVFDLLETVNTCVINYITPTQPTNGELASSSMERVGSTPTAGAVISAATIEKLIEKLTSDIDSNFQLDFFLTYRQFMSPVKLCKWLMLRFRWAVMEETEVRRLVRIRTFVVLRYWMTYFWVQDFKPSRTLRFILSTFLSQLRAHPAIVDSDRDSRIIRNLRNIFKKQRKLHLSEEMQLSSSRESAININDNDIIAEESEVGRDEGLQSTKDYRKDSAIGMPSSHHKHSMSLDNSREPKPSLSTPVVPILKRSRRLSENSQRGVNDSNEWSARLTFGLRSVKRTVPAMYRSLVEGFVGNNTSDNACKCEDFRRESRISQGSDDMMDSRSYKSNASKSATLSTSYRSRRVGKSSSHIEKSSGNELRLYAPRPRPSQSLTEPPRNYSEFSAGSDMYQQPHPNPACPYHLSISPPNVASPPNISYVPSTLSKAKSFSTDMESAIHSGFKIDPQSNITLRYPQKSFILQHRSEVIMQQFCIIEKELLECVTWVEIVEMRWKKTRAPVSQRSDEGNGSTSNVVDCHIDAVIEWFNISYIWVISEIVSIHSLEARVQVVEKFIRIALKCYHHRNYSTLLQILLALQSPYVSRLNKTWNRVDQYERQIFERLKDLPNPERNWKRVRNCMTSAVEAVAETQAVEAILSDDGPDQPMFLSQRGSIPFLGLYLADMTSNAEMPTFISNSSTRTESAPLKDNNGTHDLANRLAKTPLVNYNKFRITASVVKHVLAFQLLAKCYQFERYDTVYDYLKHMVCLDNNEIREASFQCEE